MSNFNIDWQLFTRRLFDGFAELLRFNFSVTNPVFWLFFLVILLVLVRSWKIKKAFSFCFVIALVLLAETKIENHIIEFFKRNREQFDPLLIRIACIVVIFVVSLYYFFVKSNND
ncbi:MAG: hypothetical protein PHP17_01615 [Candidatus Omnitrophica bacterium]|nr:hypothetical protein [Candidatus Omnitrophota bacterium]